MLLLLVYSKTWCISTGWLTGFTCMLFLNYVNMSNWPLGTFL